MAVEVVEVEAVGVVDYDGGSTSNSSRSSRSRVTKSENFPDSKIFVAKTFRLKRVNRVNFQIRDKCA